MFLENTSIQRKITLVIMLTTIASLVLAFLTLFIFEIRDFRQILSRELSTIADIVGSNSTAALEFDDAKAAQQILDGADRDPRVVIAALYDAHGKIFASYKRDGTEIKPPDYLDEATAINGGFLATYHNIKLANTEIGTVFILATSRQIYDRLIQYSFILLLGLALASLSAFILSSFLRNLISAPILSLAATVKQISQDNDYSIRAVKTSSDETGILIDQFNAMIHQISVNNFALKESAKLVKESENQLQSITDSLPVLIAYFDTSNRFKFANATYEEWFELSPRELKGASSESIFGSDVFRVFLPNIKRVLSGERVKYETQLLVPLLGLREVSVVYVPDFEENGGVKGYYSLISDITSQKYAENELRILNEALELRVHERTLELEKSQEQLRRSERLASIGTLAAGIAHEIRNPLNSIHLAAQYALRKKGSLDDSLRTILETIGTEAVRCGTIIKNVLLFAKSEKTEKTVHELNEVIMHAIDLAKSYSKTKFNLSMKLQSDGLPVTMNPTEIEQVILNVVNNAMEAAGGDSNVEIKSYAQDGRAVITIKDDGPGIPPEVINHIFDPFFSTKRQQGNTGLGLSLCHGIVTEHQGDMTVESSTGVGTTFRISFPRALQ